MLRALVLALVLATSPLHAADLGTLILGSESVRVKDVAQLTRAQTGSVASASISPDGATIAAVLFKNDVAHLALVNPESGDVKVLKSGVPVYLELETGRPKAGETVWRLCDSRINWSSDSSLFCLGATKITRENDRVIEREYVIVVDREGSVKNEFPVAEGYSAAMAPLFSLDASKIAMGEACIARPGMRVMVCDRTTGGVKEYETPDYTDMARWTQDGSKIQYWAYVSNAPDNNAVLLREIALADGSDEPVGKPIATKGSLSPDGKTRAVPGKKGLSLEDQASGDSKLIVKGSVSGASSWSPDGRLVVFTQPYAIRDDEGQRAADVRQLWIAAAEKHKLNYLLVSLDWEPSVLPTWSADCSRLAFISRGRLFLATFGRQAVTPAEKIEAGIAYTSDDEKALVMENAKQIAAAFGQYLLSQNALPANLEDLYAMSDKVYFLRPNTSQVIFKYEATPGTPMNKVSNDTLLGTLDAGLGWRIKVYLGGKVVEEPAPNAN